MRMADIPKCDKCGAPYVRMGLDEIPAHVLDEGCAEGFKPSCRCEDERIARRMRNARARYESFISPRPLDVRHRRGRE